MRTFFTLLLISFFSYSGLAQFSSEKIISTSKDSPLQVYTTDMNKDGLLDIVVTSSFDDKVSWYKNDGNQGFTENLITSAAGGTDHSTAIDLEGDGDMDIIVAAMWDQELILLENNGSQAFTKKTIDNGISAFRVWAGDMDKDNDMDIVLASHFPPSATISWYENDGAQNFTEHLISSDYIISIYVEDIELDGDMDILYCSSGNELGWFENDGSQNFSSHVVSTSQSLLSKAILADIDQDSHLDILATSINDNQVTWYENDGSQNFSLHIISNVAMAANSCDVADLDNDGDMDVLSASQADNKVAWYENDGSQNFSEHILSSTAAIAVDVNASDLDGDGDVDVLSVSRLDDKLAWYENTTTFVGIPENIQYSDWYVYQNDDRINLRFSQHHPINNRIRISLTSMSSQVVYEGYPPINDNLIEIPKKDLKPGIYILKWQSEQGQGSTKLIIGRNWRQS